MKLAMHHVLRSLIAALLLAGMCCAGVALSMGALPERVQLAAAALMGIGLLSSMLHRRVKNEDRITHLEAALCREQSARSQADHALAEADLLLARLTARASGNCAGDPAGQLVLIQAELTQIQQRCAADQGMRMRLELIRARLDRLGNTLRTDSRTVEPG